LEREKIRVHQINRKTGNRIKYCKVDAATGTPVSDDDIVKGYEVGKGHYVEITDDELEAVASDIGRAAAAYEVPGGQRCPRTTARDTALHYRPGWDFR
jgi:non-homologous end joining protein Ku